MTEVVEFQNGTDKPKSIDLLLSNLRGQGWKIKVDEFSKNMTTYEGRFMQARLYFTSRGDYSDFIAHNEIEKAAVDFAVQQIRRLK